MNSVRLTELAQPVAELPVADLERARQYYCDALGFVRTWNAGDELGAVARGEVAIFLRLRRVPFQPAVHWWYAPDLRATYEELKGRGATIIESLELKPWGKWQFTVKDLDGNIFYFH